MTYSHNLAELAELRLTAELGTVAPECYLAVHLVGAGRITVGGGLKANGKKAYGKVDPALKPELVALGLATADSETVKNGKTVAARGTVHQNCTKYGVLGAAILAQYPDLLSESVEDITTTIDLFMAVNGYTSVADMYNKVVPSGEDDDKDAPTLASKFLSAARWGVKNGATRAECEAMAMALIADAFADA